MGRLSSTLGAEPLIVNTNGITSSQSGRAVRDPIPAIVHISGRRRGITERLPGDTIHIDLNRDSGIALVAPDGSTTSEHYATLHPAGQTYELAVAPGQTVWVNGESVDTKMLESGDLLEIGKRGPVVRFRLYAPGTQIHKSVGEAFADCIDCVRHEDRSLPGRVTLFFTAIARELTTQTSIWFRVVILTLVAMLVLTTVLLTRHSLDLEQRLAEEQARISGLAELIERAQSEAFDRRELIEMRNALETDLSETAQRLEVLEARSAAVRQVIAAAAQSTLFIQGSFGFEDPETNQPLRLLLGPNGQPLRTPEGQPAVTLEGEGPVLEINYTGTAFLASPNGELITNRHVALPWENDEAYQGIIALGLTPVTRRLIGYLSGIEEPFEVELVAASDKADVAILRCSAVTGLRPPLTLSENAPSPGDEVIVLGYPTGIRALLARAGKAFIDDLANQKDLDFWSIASHLSAAGHISPLASRGIVGQVTAEAVVYDAETTQGGSGGPVLGLSGDVFAINAAILPEFGGSNLGVPVKYAKALFTQSGESD